MDCGISIEENTAKSTKSYLIFHLFCLFIACLYTSPPPPFAPSIQSIELLFK